MQDKVRKPRTASTVSAAIAISSSVQYFISVTNQVRKVSPWYRREFIAAGKEIPATLNCLSPFAIKKESIMPTTLSKVLIFLLIPTLAGMFGLYAAYLTSLRDSERKMTIEADFGLPFMLTLLLVVVIGFQTSGYKSSEVKPLVRWPKVKKRRKITHKHVVKSDDGDDADDADDADDDVKGEGAKKND